MIGKYADLLKDRRWLNKRNRIIKRDGYKCTCCGSTKNLRVHHTYYFDDFPPPWQYPDDSLLTVCYECHNEYHFYHENTTVKRKSSTKKKKSRNKKKQSNPKRRNMSLAAKVEKKRRQKARRRKRIGKL